MQVDITPVVLKTKRLTLRAFRQDDLLDFNRYASVNGVGMPAGWKTHESLEESQEILDLFLEKKNTFALVLGDRVIGSIGMEVEVKPEFTPLLSLEEKKHITIGYVLAKEYWGRGLMPEAAQEVLRYLYEELDVDCVLGSYFTFNLRSGRVFEKLGFTAIGSRQVKTSSGSRENIIDLALWRDSWERSKDLQ